MYSDQARTSLNQVEEFMFELLLQGSGGASSAATYHVSAGGARVRATRD